MNIFNNPKHLFTSIILAILLFGTRQLALVSDTPTWFVNFVLFGLIVLLSVFLYKSTQKPFSPSKGTTKK